MIITNGLCVCFWYNLAGTLIWKAIPLLDKSERFSVKLPNAFNFSFSFAWFLRVYLVFLIVGEYVQINGFTNKTQTEQTNFTERFKLISH